MLSSYPQSKLHCIILKQFSLRLTSNIRQNAAVPTLSTYCHNAALHTYFEPKCSTAPLYCALPTCPLLTTSTFSLPQCFTLLPAYLGSDDRTLLASLQGTELRLSDSTLSPATFSLSLSLKKEDSTINWQNRNTQKLVVMRQVRNYATVT
jgi:hypothetical protein